MLLETLGRTVLIIYKELLREGLIRTDRRST